MKPVVIAVFVIALCMSLTSMVPRVDEGPDARATLGAEESVLKIGFLQNVDSLNPFIGLTDASRVFYGLVYDSLFSVGNDLETVGNLATGWRPVPLTDPEMVMTGEPYGSVWEYNLTPNARWHDGEPFTVDDAAWVVNLNADYYDTLWAHQPYTFFTDYAEVIDSDTVRIHFYDRSSGEPMPVAYGDSLFIPMVPRHMLSGMTPASIAFMWNGTFVGSETPIIGTGPFTATEDIWAEYSEGERLTLVRNPSYHWAEDKGEIVQFDKVVMYFYDDPTAMALALEIGHLDVAQFPPQTYLAIEEDVLSGDLEDVSCFDGLKVTQYWTEVAFNMNDAGPNPARLDPAVRHALATATDKQYIVDMFYAGRAGVGSTLISPVSETWHYDPTAEEMFQYDLDAAAQALEDSGYRYSVESPEVRVATVDSLAVQEGYVPEGTPLVFDMLVRREAPEERDIASYLQFVWSEIGVDVDYRVVDEATLSTEVYAYAYDTVIWYWSSDPDPNYMLFCQSKYSWAGWSDNMYFNESYDDNYNASVMALDLEDRMTYVDNCQRIHYEDAAYLILAYPHQTYAWRTDTFTGWGDWEKDPGRSLDAYWGANPLLFDLTPLLEENAAPINVALDCPDADVYAGYFAAFIVSADDVDEDGLMIELDLGDGTAQAQTFLAGESTHYEATFMHTYELPGDYELTVTADDQTGLSGHAVIFGPVSLSVLEDSTAPETVISLDGDAGDNDWYVSAVNMSLLAFDVQDGLILTEWALNDGAWTEYDDPVAITAEGVNDYAYRSTDLVGNVEETKHAEVKIDMSAPVMDTDKETGFKARSSTIVIAVAHSDAVSGVHRLTVSLDGGLETNVSVGAEVTLEDVGDGKHTVVLKVYDEAGNSANVTLEFEVETSVFALDGPAGPWIVVGMLAAVFAIVGVSGFLMYRRMKIPKP